jgi:Iron/zinc purple acid phosphatase-like protein C
MHVTIGTAGARLDDAPTMDDVTWTEKLILGQFGYGRVTVHNASALHLEFIKHGVPGDPNGGAILDDVWLERRR